MPLLRNGANRGSASAPKAKQKEPVGSLGEEVTAGNTSRKSAHAVFRTLLCARAIAAQWGEPRVRFRTESQTKKSPKALEKIGFPHRCAADVREEEAQVFGSSREGRSGGHCSLAPTRYSRREYFAQIGACGFPNVALRSCHCCAMGRTAGSLPHRKPNKKEPVGSFLFGTPAGNRTRNGPLGGGCYIHLTTEAYHIIPPGIRRRCAPRATACGGANPKQPCLLRA